MEEIAEESEAMGVGTSSSALGAPATVAVVSTAGHASPGLMSGAPAGDGALRGAGEGGALSRKGGGGVLAESVTAQLVLAACAFRGAPCQRDCAGAARIAA
jgi:hypothetical protein